MIISEKFRRKELRFNSKISVWGKQSKIRRVKVVSRSLFISASLRLSRKSLHLRGFPLNWLIKYNVWRRKGENRHNLADAVSKSGWALKLQGVNQQMRCWQQENTLLPRQAKDLIGTRLTIARNVEVIILLQWMSNSSTYHDTIFFSCFGTIIISDVIERDTHPETHKSTIAAGYGRQA